MTPIYTQNRYLNIGFANHFKTARFLKFRIFREIKEFIIFVIKNTFYNKVENIDDIIRRPFVESLVISLYFTEDPDL